MKRKLKNKKKFRKMTLKCEKKINFLYRNNLLLICKENCLITNYVFFFLFIFGSIENCL